MKSRRIINVILISLFLVFGSFVSTTIFAQSNSNVWKVPEIANKLKNPLKGNTKATKKGESLFNVNCATCHGNEGKGNGIASAGLNPKPADFTSKRVMNESDGALFWKITKGKPPMPSWEETFTSNQRWQLVNYIRKLQTQSKKKKN